MQATKIVSDLAHIPGSKIARLATIDAKVRAGAVLANQSADVSYAEVLSLPTETFPSSVASLTEALAEAVQQQKIRGQETQFCIRVRNSFENGSRKKMGEHGDSYKVRQARLTAAVQARVRREAEVLENEAELRRAASRELARHKRRERELQTAREQSRRAAHEAREVERRHREKVLLTHKSGEEDARLERDTQFFRDAAEAERTSFADKK